MDKGDKLISERTEAYKKKSTTIDKRALRAHRRSQEWKCMRQEKANKNRNLADMSPVKEELSFQKQQKPKDEKKVDQRRQDLLKWKQEKELKKKLDRDQKTQPVFKIGSCSKPLSKVPVGKPSQASVSKPSQASAGKTSQASVGNTSQASVSKPSQASVGKTSQASVGKLSQHTVGKPSQAPVGKPSQASVGKTSQASVGKLAQHTVGKPSQAPVGKTSQASVGKRLQAPVSKATFKPHVTTNPPQPTERTTRSQSSRQHSRQHETQKPDVKKNRASAASTNIRSVCLTRSTRSLRSSSSDKGISSEHTNLENEVFASNNEGLTKEDLVEDSMDVEMTESNTEKSEMQILKIISNDVTDTPRVENSILSRPGVENSNDDVSTPTMESDVKLTKFDVNKVSCSRGSEFSFDPEKYNFKPSENISALSFQPLSPASTSNFLFPGHSFNSPLFDGPFKVPFSSDKRKTPARQDLRNSLILRKLSPEEKAEVILHSPMVDTKRRTPRMPSGKRSVDPLPTFDDLDLATLPKLDFEAMAEAGKDISTESSSKLSSSPKRLDSIEEEEGDTHSEPQDQNPNNIETEINRLQKESQDIDFHGDSIKSTNEVSDSDNKESHRADVLNDISVPHQVTNHPELGAHEDINTCGDRDTVEECTVESNVTDVAAVQAENNVLTEDQPMDIENKVNPVVELAETKEINRDVIHQLEPHHDVPYFRNLVQSETDRLNAICAKWEIINAETQEITDDTRGQIRSTIGQTHLLMVQRFKQFLGLVDNCEFNTGENVINCSDLQGFWDMVYFQVEDVDVKFEKLSKLKDNNWVIDEPKEIVQKAIKKKAAVKKPAVKSKFAAFRAKMKEQESPTIEVNAINSEDDKIADVISNAETTLTGTPSKLMKTFDAGFFKISSPISTSPKFHCEVGTPKSCIRRMKSSPLLKVVHRNSLNRSTGCSPKLLTKSSSPQSVDLTLAKMLEPTTLDHETALKTENIPPLEDQPSLFTPEKTSTQLRRSSRKSLRMTTLTNNSITVANTSTTKCATDDDIFNRYLQPIPDSPCKENQAISTPSKINTRKSLLFTPYQRIHTPVKPLTEEGKPSPTINLMSFSPSMNL